MVVKSWDLWFVKEISRGFAFVFLDKLTYRELSKYISNQQVFELNERYYWMDIMDYPAEYDSIIVFGIYECTVRGIEKNDNKMLITKEKDQWIIKKELRD